MEEVVKDMETIAGRRAGSRQTSRLHLEVFTSTPSTFQATSTLVYGDLEAILIDAQLTLSEGRRLVNVIRPLARDLKTVYVTHGHPDHYWGANAIRDAYPNADFVALPEVIEVIGRLRAGEYATWKPVYGDDIPDSPVIPRPLRGRTLDLEGNTLEVIKGQGDVEGSSFIWVPGLKTAITGDIVSNNVHIWVLETDKAGRRRWLETIDQIAKLQPDMVVAGHKEPDAADDPGCLSFTRSYLVAWDRAVEASRSADEIIATMKAKFPQARGLEAVLEMAARAAFSGK